MARIFLTGGSGFIGGSLAARLVERGDEVVGLARSDAAAAKLERCGVTPVRGDVLDYGSLVAGMAGCRLAFHVAGVNSHCPEDPDQLLRVNVAGPPNVIRAAAAAGVGRVVFTSSAASLGEAAGTIGTEDCPHRGSYLSVYDRSKHEGERAAFATGRSAGVEIVAVNPSSVQGPGRKDGNGALIIALLNGRLRAFVRTHVSLVDIDDCVEGHLLAAERGRDGERYVLNGATISSEQALEIVAGLSGIRQPVWMVPAPVARGAAALLEAAFRAGRKTSPLCRARVRTLLHGHRYDASRSERELGLAYAPVADTFRRTIVWAVAEGLVTRPLPATAPFGPSGV
ncbi:MAG: SDR family NAD(P)-dependent oxidoreductase [Actinomycetota bacterium]|nr:SDR family NAD(P)-dependent oxidoreductase [Actinomycetota bacterium]